MIPRRFSTVCISHFAFSKTSEHHHIISIITLRITRYPTLCTVSVYSVLGKRKKNILPIPYFIDHRYYYK